MLSVIKTLKRSITPFSVTVTSLLMQDHPELQSCHHFDPSKELLSRVNDALLCKKLPSPLLQITTLGHFDPANSTSLNTVGLST